MTKKKELLLKELKEIVESLQDNAIEVSHIKADEALIRFINDKEITKAYDDVPKWYS